METRTLEIRSCGTNRRLREYVGRYSECYDAVPPDMAARGTAYIAIRIGKIYDAVKGRVAVFRQGVQRLHAPRPTHVWVNERWRGGTRYVGESYSFDPGCTKVDEDGGEHGELCCVWELVERAPTPEESLDVQANPTASAKTASAVSAAERDAAGVRALEYGCLTVFGDFQKVMCHGTPYDLTDATQARELLRFLCAKKARNQDTARKKTEILKALQSAGGTVANDWRPAHVFRGKLEPLYRAAIGRNKTKGLYWINP